MDACRAIGLDALDAAALDQEAGDLGLGVDLDAAPHRLLGIAPGDAVMPRDGAGRMVERAEDRIAHVVRHVHHRAEPGDVVRADQFGIDAEMLVDLGPPARRAQRGVGMGEGEMAALGIHDVDVELDRQAAEQLDRFLVEGDTLRRQVVGAHDGGVAGGVAAGEPAAVEHRDIGDAVMGGEVIGRGEAVPAGADDDDVVARLQVGGPDQVGIARMVRAQTHISGARAASSVSAVRAAARPVRFSRGFAEVQENFRALNKISGR